MARRAPDPESAAGHQTQALRRYIRLLVAVGGILIVLACSPQPVTRLSVAPASTLTLAVTLDYAQVPSTDQVQVTVNLASSKSPGAKVLFSGGQYLTVDGVRLPESNPRAATIPRQPPGGHYTLVYTDEHGTRTSADIPAPQADFAVLDPAPGAQVALPGRETGAIPTPTALPTPTAMPLTPSVVSSRLLEGAHTPVVVRYAVPYRPSSLPTSPLNQTPNGAAAYKVSGLLSGSYTPQQRCYPSIVASTDEATGTLTFKDWYLDSGQGFECFTPGPGTIRLIAQVQWYTPHSGFSRLQLAYYDLLDAPITWLRA